jgi:hypothetical protein
MEKDEIKGAWNSAYRLSSNVGMFLLLLFISDIKKRRKGGAEAQEKNKIK